MTTALRPDARTIIEPHPEREREHRTAAKRAVTVSAIGLALTGAIELAIALVSGSVALLGDALHNLSDVSTSRARGWEVTSEIVHLLMDGVDPEHLRLARGAAMSVSSVHAAVVAGRWMGRSLTLEIEGHMDAATRLERAELIGKEVEVAVRAAVDQVRHVRWIPTQVRVR